MTQPTPRQKAATIIAALRYYQSASPSGQFAGAFDIQQIATDGGTLEPLDAEAIDALCEEINLGPARDEDSEAQDAWETLDYVVSLARDGHKGDADEGLIDHPEDECEDCREIERAGAILEAMKESTVTIEILGGCLSEVSGLLPGQTYHLIDHD